MGQVGELEPGLDPPHCRHPSGEERCRNWDFRSRPFLLRGAIRAGERKLRAGEVVTSFNAMLPFMVSFFLGGKYTVLS